MMILVFDVRCHESKKIYSIYLCFIYLCFEYVIVITMRTRKKALTSVASFPSGAACIRHLGSVLKMRRIVLTLMCNDS